MSQSGSWWTRLLDRIGKWWFDVKWRRTNRLLAAAWRKKFPYQIGTVTASVAPFTPQFRDVKNKTDDSVVRPIPYETVRNGPRAIVAYVLAQAGQYLDEADYYLMRRFPRIEPYDIFNDEGRLVERNLKCVFRLYVQTDGRYPLLEAVMQTVRDTQRDARITVMVDIEGHKESACLEMGPEAAPWRTRERYGRMNAGLIEKVKQYTPEAGR